jgi:uncharacterized protein
MSEEKTMQDATAVRAASAAVRPVQPGERIELLDALRGLALLGILFANIRQISGWTYLSAEQRAALPTWSVDQALNVLSTILVAWKFYSIFSLLFGIGFVVLMLRMERRGGDFLPLFRRRLLLLLGFGFVHYFVWEGDILVLYALVGFLLIPARRLSDRTLLIGATALLLAPIALHTLYVVSNGALLPGRPLHDVLPRIDRYFGWDPETSLHTIRGHGGWIDLMKFNAFNLLWGLGNYLDDARPLKVLAMFLVGFVAARRAILHEVSAHIPLLRRVLLIGGAIGLIGSGAFAYIRVVLEAEYLSSLGIVAAAAFAVGTVPLALAYVSAFALLWQQPHWQRRLLVLAPVGRMALSNYLAQSLIAAALFYGVGLGWWGQAGLALLYPLALLIFGAQIAWSPWWLARFHFGPAEWLWRSLTYRQAQPMRRSDAATLPVVVDTVR